MIKKRERDSGLSHWRLGRNWGTRTPSCPTFVLSARERRASRGPEDGGRQTRSACCMAENIEQKHRTRGRGCRREDDPERPRFLEKMTADRGGT